MALSNQEHQEIMHIYDQRRLDNRKKQEDRKKEIDQKIPRITQINEELRNTAFSLGKLLLSHPSAEATKDYQDRSQALIKEKLSLLAQHGYPVDYLEPIYQCPACKDTGYIGQERCSCFQSVLTSLIYARSNMKHILAQENFQTFREDFYSDQATSNGMLSPRQNIHRIWEQCQDFVQHFPHHENILFHGSTGVGKTFLSHCIAKEVMDAGYSCIYVTAFQLFDELAKETFGKKEKQSSFITMESILNCDLLIIDDLGTELTNNFVISQLFQCLNERLLNQRSTIISTNLSTKELRNVYSERIFSRLIESYSLLKVYGDDIRFKKSHLT